MDPSSMVATIDDLERKGLVERRAHPSDRRAYALHVTEAGREILSQGREVVNEVQDELLAPLDEAEREQLRSLLVRLVTAAGNTS
jgi:DNA-binding MarR family transcriptional regulator